MDHKDPSTSSIDGRAGKWVHRRSSEPLPNCSLQSSIWSFLFLRWWTWGMSSCSFTTQEVDSSPRLLLEQTTSTPGECIHNQLVSLSLAVLYLNLHFRCLALMHQENDQSSVTAEADGLKLDSAVGVTSEATWQNVEGGNQLSLKVNCFYTDMNNLHLYWLNKSFLHEGHRFSVQGPRVIDFSLLTVSLLSSRSLYFIKPHAFQPGCLSWRMSFWFGQLNVLNITFWWLSEDLQRTT